MILGIDEVGRGPWAGPLVVGAVVLPETFELEGMTDSKKLTAKKRAEFDAVIRETALGYGLGWVHADEIDQVGLSAALKLATVRAVEAVQTTYHEIIIDGTINFLNETTKGKFVKTMPKADLLVPSVSAASIIAKVARDAYMQEQDGLYPQYGFASHVGYGTAKHAAALAEHGVTPLHRKSFAPIAKIINASAAQPSKQARAFAVTTKSIGDAAERHVTQHLEAQGYRVVARNWRTKHCEIDIVAEKDTTRYFVEVKRRKSNDHGDGIAAITPRKVERMRFAAECYNAIHATSGDSRLAIAAVDANDSIRFLTIE